MGCTPWSLNRQQDVTKTKQKTSVSSSVVKTHVDGKEDSTNPLVKARSQSQQTFNGEDGKRLKRKKTTNKLFKDLKAKEEGEGQQFIQEMAMEKLLVQE